MIYFLYPERFPFLIFWLKKEIEMAFPAIKNILLGIDKLNGNILKGRAVPHRTI
jgi:hypothetical protein